MNSPMVKPATPFAMGFDVLASVEDTASALVKAGMRFAVRYLGSVTPNELSTLLAAGLAFMPVTLRLSSESAPSAAKGATDGAASVAQCQALKLVPGITVWLDLEACVGDPASTAAWVNAWAGVVRAAGFDPGLYVGAGQVLDGVGLGSLAVDRYWQGCSVLVAPGAPAGYTLEPNLPNAFLGWCMRQLPPADTVIAGVEVDVDVIQHDWKGRVPNWMVAG